MGAIRAVASTIDQAKTLNEEQGEILSILEELAKTKAAIYEEELDTFLRTAGKDENQSIAITKVLKSHKWVHAYSSKSSSAIPDAVTKALRSFLSGGKDEIINGISQVMSEAVSVFLGDASGSSDEFSEYYIATEGLSIVRMDIKGWYREINAKSLSLDVEKICVFVAKKSSVNLHKIDFNEFLNIYHDQLNRSDLDYNQLQEALKSAIECYEQFRLVFQAPETANPALAETYLPNSGLPINNDKPQVSLSNTERMGEERLRKQ